jgi:hypothetical protein
MSSASLLSTPNNRIKTYMAALGVEAPISRKSDRILVPLRVARCSSHARRDAPGWSLQAKALRSIGGI